MTTIEAENLVQATMQIGDGARAGALVQTIDILRHQMRNLARALPFRQCHMATVRLRPSKPGPSDQAACPVALSCSDPAHLERIARKGVERARLTAVEALLAEAATAAQP